MHENAPDNKFFNILSVLSFSIMLFGLFYSRAILTFGICSFFILVLFQGSFRISLKKYVSDPFAMILLLLFLIPFISGLWSFNKEEWWHSCSVKLPLVFLPFAFLNAPKLTWVQKQVAPAIFILLVAGGTIWSIYYYLQDRSLLEAGYLISHLIDVPLNNDHILFSWAVVISLLLLGSQIPKLQTDNSSMFHTAERVKQLENKELQTDNKSIFHKAYRLLRYIAMIWLIVYLHLLASRTGLLAFYVLAVTWLVASFRKRPILHSLMMIAICVTLPLIAFNILPSFHNRIVYMLYDARQYLRGNFLPGFSDVSRAASYRGGLDLLQHNLIGGVGFGDVHDAMNNWYAHNFAQFSAHDKILPHNEWLMFGAGAGIPGVVIITACAFYPIFNRTSWLVTAFHITACLCFLTDLPLELQNGTFIFCFFSYLLRSGLKKEA